MPDTALGSREAGQTRQTRSCLHGVHSLVEIHNKQVKKSINKQSSIMKDTTNKMKFNDVVENDEWRRQIQNFM